jgi:hypothetical protein
MKTIYSAILARLTERAPELAWIDIDLGQADNQRERPGVAFPCALVDVALNNCEDLYGAAQLCRASVRVRVIQNPPVNRTPEGLERYGLVNSVYDALQGYGTDYFNPLTRKSQQRESRSDGLFIVRIEFATEFEEYQGGE